jgi:OOP family OmpA-OmpF porin
MSTQPCRSVSFTWQKKEGLDWNGGELLPGNINIPGIETGNGVLSRDGERFYFTRCERNWQGEMICAIYRSTKEGDRWTKIEKLPPIINDPNYTATQPALGRTAKSDREIIFFVSNRPEGKGGFDIWYTVWDDEKDRYSRPRNLGSRINTVADEMTPFYNLTTRTLYFSSTGKPGIGGFDIFSAFGERRKWSRIKNIGYPINSSYDDLYFTVSKKGEDGFLFRTVRMIYMRLLAVIIFFLTAGTIYIRITVYRCNLSLRKRSLRQKTQLSWF